MKELLCNCGNMTVTEKIGKGYITVCLHCHKHTAIYERDWVSQESFKYMLTLQERKEVPGLRHHW